MIERHGAMRAATVAMALLLAAQGVAVQAVDLEPTWAQGWGRSAEASGLSVAWRQGDVRSLTGQAQAVVCNPPYFPAGRGPASPDPLKRAARTEGDATLADFLAQALAVLQPGGWAVFVLPAERVGEVAEAVGNRLREVVQVGARRSVVRLGEPGPCERHLLSEDHPRIVAWVRAARRGRVRSSE